MDITNTFRKYLKWHAKSLLKYIYNKHKTRNLCLSGGSSLNCVMNSVILQTDYVDDIFIPHNAGDGGNS